MHWKLDIISNDNCKRTLKNSVAWCVDKKGQHCCMQPKTKEAMFAGWTVITIRGVEWSHLI